MYNDNYVQKWTLFIVMLQKFKYVIINHWVISLVTILRMRINCLSQVNSVSVCVIIPNWLIKIKALQIR